MTFLSKDIRDHLAGSTAILNDVGDNIYPEVIPQGVEYEKAIVINDISNEPEYYLRGEVGKHTSQIQIDYWTDGQGGKQTANAGEELIRNRLNGYKGQLGTGCYGSCRMIHNNSLSAPPFDGSDTNRRRVSMDFEIIHSATVPTFS